MKEKVGQRGRTAWSKSGIFVFLCRAFWSFILHEEEHAAGLCILQPIARAGRALRFESGGESLFFVHCWPAILAESGFDARELTHRCSLHCKNTLQELQSAALLLTETQTIGFCWQCCLCSLSEYFDSLLSTRPHYNILENRRFSPCSKI